jgi:hypothetical protein
MMASLNWVDMERRERMGKGKRAWVGKESVNKYKAQE